MVQRLKRIGALSMAKALAVLYAALGVILGCIVAVISMVSPAMTGVTGSAGTGGASWIFPMMGGVGSIILFPLIYAVIGFVGGLIGATLYNVVARVMGGIELELQ